MGSAVEAKFARSMKNSVTNEVRPCVMMFDMWDDGWRQLDQKIVKIYLCHCIPNITIVHQQIQQFCMFVNVCVEFNNQQHLPNLPTTLQHTLGCQQYFPFDATQFCKCLHIFVGHDVEDQSSVVHQTKEAIYQYSDISHKKLQHTHPFL